MASRTVLLSLAVFASGCVTPAIPPPAHPPGPNLFERAADPDPTVRAMAADELAADPSPRAVEMLLILEQRDIDPSVRARAAAAIAERKDPELSESLEMSAAHDPDPTVRAAAAQAERTLYPWRKKPGVAAGLSLLCPGCGHLYLGENVEAAGFIGTEVALLGSAALLLRGHDVGGLEGPVDSAQVPLGVSAALTAQNLWFYSIFDAYRDARVMRDDAGYKFKITRESLGELASAPFRPSVIKSPWVWAGVPLALIGGIAASYLVAPDDFTGSRSITEVDKVNVLGHDFHRGTGFAAGTAYFASMFVPVGVGEESLFRGVIQTELEERFGTYGGLAVASAIFGAVHFLNFANDPKSGAVAVPVIGILGSSLGLAYIHTHHKLSTSVAMHFWYDFLLSTIAFAADPEHQPFAVQYGATL